MIRPQGLAVVQEIDHRDAELQQVRLNSGIELLGCVFAAKNHPACTSTDARNWGTALTM
jgi:hypothetical protein